MFFFSSFVIDANYNRRISLNGYPSANGYLNKKKHIPSMILNRVPKISENSVLFFERSYTYVFKFQ